MRGRYIGSGTLSFKYCKHRHATVQSQRLSTRNLPQNTTDTSPGHDEPTQRLAHTTPEPDIPPSALAQHIPATLCRLPIQRHRDNPRHLIQRYTALDFTAVATGVKRAGACTTGTLDDKEVEESRDEDCAGEVEGEAGEGLQGEDAGGEAEEEGC